MTAHPIPPEANLLDLIELDRRWRLEDWWADFLAKCAARKARRQSKLSASALKGAETKREKEREGRRANAAFGVTAPLMNRARTGLGPAGECRLSQEVQLGERE